MAEYNIPSTNISETYQVSYGVADRGTENYYDYNDSWDIFSNGTEEPYTPYSNTTTVSQTSRPVMPQHIYQIVWIISICGNTLGVLSIVLNIGFLIGMRSLKDRSTAYHPFMKNLSVADILASFTFLVTQNWPRGPFAFIEPSKEFMLVLGLPYLFRSTPWMFFTAYLLTLSCLTINQYVAVCKPWKYSEIVSRRMVSASLIAVWAISCLQIVVPLIVLLILWGQEDKTQATMTLFRVSSIEIQVWMGVFALSTVFNIWLNILVYCKIRHLKIQRRTPGSSSNVETLGIRMKQDAFVTVSLLLAASVFCRLPFPLVALLGFNLRSLLNVRTARLLSAVVVLLLYVTFFVDPIIYVIRMKEVRRAYARFFSSCARCCRKTSYISHYRASIRMLTSRVVETTIAELNRKPSSSSKVPPLPPHIHQYVHVHVELPPESTC